MIHFRFPSDFIWGAATSSFQIEGGANDDGKGPSIWDVATRRYPEKFLGQATPTVAADFYHQYPQDVEMMKELGLKSFRFSIAWTRIFPNGTGEINAKGLDFYNRLIDKLLACGVEPFVDLYHWDLPQNLAEEGGFKNPRILDHFNHYAELCFRTYGDRVHLWSTMNEPSVMAFAHYHSGTYPPFEKDLSGALLAAHHMLLIHHRAVRLYRQMNQKGKIGAVIAFVPVYPSSFSEQDRLAAARRQDFISNWWLDPMFKGHYPESAVNHPTINPSMPPHYAEQLRDAFVPMDFVGANYYTPARAGHKPGQLLDAEHVETYYAQTDYGFLDYPQGLFDSMIYLKNRYDNPEIYITENGLAHDTEKYSAEMNGDETRIRYIREHLREIARSLQAGVKIRGYYYWSLLDTFEATSGYRYRFGLVHIDYKTLQRTRLKSWDYYQQCIHHNAID